MAGAGWWRWWWGCASVGMSVRARTPSLFLAVGRGGPSWVMPEASVLMVSVDPDRVERELAAGLLRCPGWGDPLAPWAHARWRNVRSVDGERRVRPRRARCVGCGGTRVLLADDYAGQSPVGGGGGLFGETGGHRGKFQGIETLNGRVVKHSLSFIGSSRGRGRCDGRSERGRGCPRVGVGGPGRCAGLIRVRLPWRDGSLSCLPCSRS